MHSSIHFDTNYLIAYAGEASAEVVTNVEQWIVEDRKFYCSAMAWAEFMCGPVLPEEIAAMEFLLHGVLPVSPELAAEGARLFRETGRRSRSLPDCIIAATAIAAKVPLATLNLSDFDPFLPYGLELV
ncbi:MAG: PIN domain-containing protein [Luteolibacter sp.]